MAWPDDHMIIQSLAVLMIHLCGVCLKSYLATGSEVIFWNIFKSKHKMPNILFLPSFSVRLAACRSVSEYWERFCSHNWRAVFAQLVLCSLLAECLSTGMAEKWAGRFWWYHPHLAFTVNWLLLPAEWQGHLLRNLWLFPELLFAADRASVPWPAERRDSNKAETL